MTYVEISLCLVPLCVVQFALYPVLLKCHFFLKMVCCENNDVLNQLEEAQEEAEKTKWTIGRKLQELFLVPNNGLNSLDDVFNLWDTSRDGIIDQKEFKEGLATLEIFLTKMRFKNFVRSLDPDRTGDISKEEF